MAHWPLHLHRCAIQSVVLRPDRPAHRHLHQIPAFAARRLRVVARLQIRRPMRSPRGTSRSALLQRGGRAASAATVPKRFGQRDLQTSDVLKV